MFFICDVYIHFVLQYYTIEANYEMNSTALFVYIYKTFIHYTARLIIFCAKTFFVLKYISEISNHWLSSFILRNGIKTIFNKRKFPSIYFFHPTVHMGLCTYCMMHNYEFSTILVNLKFMEWISHYWYQSMLPI